MSVMLTLSLDENKIIFIHLFIKQFKISESSFKCILYVKHDNKMERFKLKISRVK